MLYLQPTQWSDVMRIALLVVGAALLSFFANPPRAVPRSPSAQTANNAVVEAQMKIGAAAEAKQEYAAAMAAYRRAIEIDPRNADAHKRFITAALNNADTAFGRLCDNPDYEKLERGELRGQAKRTLEAEIKKAKAQNKADIAALIATYDQWTTIHPKLASFYWAKGYALSMMDKTTGPEELFNKAISLDPKFAPAYNSMAQLEYDKGNYSKQRDYLKRVMDLDPANADAVRNYAQSLQFTDPPRFRQLAEQFRNIFLEIAIALTYCTSWRTQNRRRPTASRFLSAFAVPILTNRFPRQTWTSLMFLPIGSRNRWRICSICTHRTILKKPSTSSGNAKAEMG